jgi:hypothetical protein
MNRCARVWLPLLTLLGLPGLAFAADMPGMPGMSGMAGHAAGETLTRQAGAYRIELHILMPEESYAADEVATKHIKAGMLVVGGAPALAVNASPPPNHHLVVHVFDRASGASVKDAKVRMSFQAVDPAGHLTGDATAVPVAVMQAIGAGAGSTHYGNNVVIAAGEYSVSVTVNDSTARFPIKIEH